MWGVGRVWVGGERTCVRVLEVESARDEGVIKITAMTRGLGEGQTGPPSKRGIFLRWATEATPCTGITRLKLSQEVGQGDPF